MKNLLPKRYLKIPVTPFPHLIAIKIANWVYKWSQRNMQEIFIFFTPMKKGGSKTAL